jgi:hypothetical protein
VWGLSQNRFGAIFQWPLLGLMDVTYSGSKVAYLTMRNNTGYSCDWPLLWSSGHSSWLQFQRSGFNFRRYKIFWEATGLERDPLSLVSTIEELLCRKNNGSGLENREYCRRDPPRWPRDTLYPQKLALTSQISGSRSVGIVRSRTESTEFSLFSSYSCD